MGKRYYKQRVLHGNSIYEVNISSIDANTILDSIDTEKLNLESKFLTPKFIVLNDYAYASLCVALSRKLGLETIEHVETYSDLIVVVRSPLGEYVDKYTPVIEVVPSPNKFNNGVFRSERNWKFFGEITGKNYEDL